MNNGANVGIILQIISLVLTILVVPLVKVLFSREVKRLDEKDAENKKQIEDLGAKVNEKIDKLKDDMNDMKNDMPFIYVTREDFIRSIDGVEKSMNIVANKVDKVYDHITRKGD